MKHTIVAKSFVDFGKSFSKLTETEKIEDRLMKYVNSQTIFGHCILEWIREGKPIPELIKSIQEQANDNFEMVLDVIGNRELLIEITQF
jgi:hypothetical protein